MKKPEMSDTPKDRLTRICDQMTKTFDMHPEHRPGDRCMVFLDDGKMGGIVLHGYENEKEAAVDLFLPPSDCPEAIATDDGEQWLRWYYVCTKCGYTSSSTRHDLTICTATFPIQPDWMTPPALPCGGELGDPYTYHWMLVEAGLIGGGDE